MVWRLPNWQQYGNQVLSVPVLAGADDAISHTRGFVIGSQAYVPQWLADFWSPTHGLQHAGTESEWDWIGAFPAPEVRKLAIAGENRMGETIGVLLADSGAYAHRGWHSSMDTVLGPAGLTAFHARTSREAIARVETGGLAGAVLIADRWRIDGLALLRIIRSIDLTLPCWLVTDAPTRATLETALALRAYCVMKHPPTPAELAVVVRRLMAN